MKKKRYIVPVADIDTLPVHLMVVVGSKDFVIGGGDSQEEEEEEDPNGTRCFRFEDFDED